MAGDLGMRLRGTHPELKEETQINTFLTIVNPPYKHRPATGFDHYTKSGVKTSIDIFSKIRTDKDRKIH